MNRKGKRHIENKYKNEKWKSKHINNYINQKETNDKLNNKARLNYMPS